MNTADLTLYYDGQCPFCLAEMTRLRRWNTAGKLAFVDIAEPGFDPSSLGGDMEALDRQLHSLTAEGKLLIGIDSMLVAYTLVNRGWLVLPLRVPFLRPPLSFLYRKFARHRYRLSELMGYKPVNSCKDGVCSTRHLF